ncbi:MAG TPA: sigma-54-dependent Fis family transcriptional regulator [Planctomycetes bacterium]|nr:sigma-54-dependent Fis family transcriptional regulator [Planctomycetota bacterium]
MSSLSKQMQRLLAQVDKIATNEEPVLLLGETGVGKGVIARRIHEGSPRRDKPFIPLNCAALPEALIESELFGHSKGSFTGATGTKKGLLEMADQGTLFLDEIGEMPLGLQAKLLTVLEEGRFLPVGSTRYLDSNFRLVAASNKDLIQEKDKGGFRSDLFFRIGVFVLLIPPLREWMSELPGLCDQFLAEIGKGQRFSKEALERLYCHSWPGNIRELRNVVRHSALLCEEDLIDLADLPQWILGSCAHPDVLERGSLKAKLDCFQACILKRTLEDFGGDLDQALQTLGISRSSFYRKLKEAEEGLES